MRQAWSPKDWICKMRCADGLTRHLWACLLAGITSVLCACGGGGGSSSPVVNTPVANAVPITVDAGPTGNAVNLLYTSVTICAPQSNNCQTIDHVLVDTGSSGLRLLSSVLSPTLGLPKQTGTAGTPLLSCAQFVDGSFAWGPLVSADVTLGGKVASGLSVQVISDPATRAFSSLCGSGADQSTPQALGSNGILGVGPQKEDCGTGCTTRVNNGFYYRCTSADCQSVVPTSATLAQQLKNPITTFTTDNNGLVIDLPAVNTLGAVSLNGTMYIGLATQSNNQTGAAQVFLINANGYFTTSLNGHTYLNSFIDTGSNGTYFDSAAIPRCTDTNVNGFYCPTAIQQLVATLLTGSGLSKTNTYSVGNALSLFSNRSNAVLPTLAGPMDDPASFDWGLPFFYGKRVAIAIEGQSTVLGTGPFFAY